MLTGLKIVIAQTNPTVGNIAANTDLILKHWKTHEDQSDLIVFSELILSGYPPEDLILKPSFIDHCHAAVETLKTQSAAFDCAALIGTPYYGDDGQVYNTALLIHDGEIIGRADKHHLPNYGVFDEKRTFTRGDLPEPISYKNHKLGVMICEDLWHKDVAKHLKSAGAEMLIALNGSPYETNKHNERLSHAKARVSETGLPLLYVNQVGGQDELVFDGASFAMNEGGDIADQAPIFEEHIAPLSFITHDLPDTHEQIYRACVLGLRDYVHKNGFSGVVLGLSGGIDSAVAAIMARDAVGAQNLDCIMMPSAFTSQDSLYDAQTLATRLGCTYDIIPITEPLAAFENIFAQTSPDSTRAGLAGGGAQNQYVDWMQIERIDGRAIDIGFYRHHVDPMEPFAAALSPHVHGVVATSATLCDQSEDEDQNWSAARARTGASYLAPSSYDAKFTSPFDYKTNSKVIIINDVRKDDLSQVAGAYRALFKASGGSALGLFTAIGRLRAVHNKIASDLERSNIPLYSQHIDDIDAGTLVDIFRDDEAACLLGTDAIRDGVDVPGASLKLLVFDRVPWPRPTILHKARREAFGKRRYDEMLTRLKLKQAYGRLIRRNDDKGVFVMLDSMLPSRLHGAFPPDVDILKIGLNEAVQEIETFLKESSPAT